MSTSTVDYTPSQDGRLTGGNTWDDAGIFLGSVAAASWFGTVFDFGVTQESARSLALNPPLLYGLDIVFQYPITPATAILACYFVPEFTPADYGIDTVRPGYRSEYLLKTWTQGTDTFADGSTIDITLTDGSGIADATLTDGATTRNITLNNGTAVINASDTRDLAANWTLLRSYTSDGSWDGKLALTFYLQVDVGSTTLIRSSDHATDDPPTLSASQSTFHTGLNTGRRVRDRIRHCPRSGLPAYTDEFVRDGYHEGTWVLADWHEPEDRVGMDNNIPPDEGVIKDEVA